MSDERISIAELRAAAVERDEGEPDGHVCMTGDYALALLHAVGALHDLMSGINYSGEPSGPADVERARNALARFDFSEGDAA